MCRAGRRRRIARYARRVDARARYPGGAGRSQFKREGFLPSARVPGERSSNAKRGLAHRKGISIAASGEAEAGGSDGVLNRLRRLIFVPRGATLAPAWPGPVGALAAGCQEEFAWRTIRCTI